MSLSLRTSIATSALLSTILALGTSACYERQPLELIRDFTPPGEEVRYELLSLCFGQSPVDGESPFFLPRPSKSEKIAHWRFWLVRGGGRVIVIDPGFVDKATAKELKLSDAKSHEELLAEVGLALRDVTDVLLTRMSRFRDDACSLFPDARFHVQSVHYARAQMKVAHRKHLALGISTDTLRFLKRVDTQNRLLLLDGTVEIFDGLKVNVTRAYGRYALSYFTVQTEDGRYVIPGDLVPYDSFLDNRLKRADKLGNDRDLHKVFVRLAGERDRVLPSFDPALGERFQMVSDSIVQIAGRSHESVVADGT